MTDVLARSDRQLLRRIQDCLHKSQLGAEGVVEQLGTVDVYFHPTNLDPYVNCVTPHRGVAWVKRDDLDAALEAMSRLGRVPYFIFQEALFPSGFQQQLSLMGMTLESERAVTVYNPLYGPVPARETVYGCLPETLPIDVDAFAATTPDQLRTWLRVFQEAYYNDQSPDVDPGIVDILAEEVAAGRVICVLASYQDTPLGVTQIALRDDSAEFEIVTTMPLWHGMGLEEGMIITAVREAEASGCGLLFMVHQPDDNVRLYRRLGFVDLTRVLTFK